MNNFNDGGTGGRLRSGQSYPDFKRDRQRSKSTRNQDRNNNATGTALSGDDDGNHSIEGRRGRKNGSLLHIDNVQTLLGGSTSDGEVQFANLEEENVVLRRHTKKQEAQIKVLATKLVRIMGERRTEEKRDKIQIGQQKIRITELEQTVSTLKDKLQVKQQQLTSYTKFMPSAGSASRHSIISSSPSAKSVRIGESKSSINSKVGKRSSSTRSGQGQILLDSEFTAKVEQFLLEAKEENQALQDELRSTKSTLSMTEKDLERSSRMLKELDQSHQEELRRLKSQLGAFGRQDKEKTVQENIHMIKLERESRSKSSWISTMQTQCGALEASLSSANATIGQLESQISSLQDEIRDGPQKILSLQREKEDSGSKICRLKELEASIKGLRNENNILKQTNESLVQKTLKNVTASSSRSKFKDKDEDAEILKEELNKMEVTLKSELTLKAQLSESLNAERVKATELEQNVTELKEQLHQLSLQLQDLSEQLNKYKNADSQTNEIKKEKEELQAMLGKTRGELIQVKEELDSTRSLLSAQSEINAKSQLEIERLTAKSIEDQKVQECMELLVLDIDQSNVIK